MFMGEGHAGITEMFAFFVVNIGAQTRHLKQSANTHAEIFICVYDKHDCTQAYANEDTKYNRQSSIDFEYTKYNIHTETDQHKHSSTNDKRTLARPLSCWLELHDAMVSTHPSRSKHTFQCTEILTCVKTQSSVSASIPTNT